MSVVIIDYGSGNLRSAAKAFERAAPDAEIIVSADPAALASASHIVLPGVGAFADCIQSLNSVSGMRDALEQQVLKQKKPFLGICVGMQLLFDEGREHGTHKGLGWIKGEVVKITPSDASLKIPHMGWNELEFTTAHPLLAGIAPKNHAYFVHSYHAICADTQDVIATTHYSTDLTALVAHENIMGTQFHPEKSQETGLQLIANFLGL